MIEAVRKINKIDRRTCREHVKANFSLRQMVEEYEKTYLQIIHETSSVKRLSRKVAGTVQRSVKRTAKTIRVSSTGSRKRFDNTSQ
jgi:hypothetical protein